MSNNSQKKLQVAELRHITPEQVFELLLDDIKLPDAEANRYRALFQSCLSTH